MTAQSIRFLLVGILNTIVGYSIYYLCLEMLNLHYVISLVISHSLGVIHSYFWNSKWTFNEDSAKLRSFYKFSSVYVVTFFLNLLILSLLIQVGNINRLLAQAFALSITTLISFIGHKYWSFTKNNTTE